MELTLENEIRVNIQRVAEGYLGLSRIHILQTKV